MTRHICAVCVLCLCNLCLPLAAQSIRYEGMVVNHGAAAAHIDAGISALLHVTIVRDGTTPGSGIPCASTQGVRLLSWGLSGE
ncbi:MAG: hypothetical protein SF070_15505 [Gemmatimonadota bacterium]|nr:hypothetical protein [Gemmatimonadota bacterium]